MSLFLINRKAQRVASHGSIFRMFSSIEGSRSFPTANSHQQYRPSPRMLPMIHTTTALVDKRTLYYPMRRSLSTYGETSTSNSNGMRSYPQYTVYGEESVMNVKMMPPHFRFIKNNILLVDTTKKGRLLLEFAPRGADGRHVWQDSVRFGLSAEETGLLVNQLPHYKVEFSRVQTARGESDQMYGNPMSIDVPEKVLRVEPGDLGTVSFIIDFVRDGVGGQAPAQGQDGTVGPLKVDVHAGEFEVLSSIMRYSIPHLTGWSRQVEIAMQNQVNESLRNPSGGSSGGGGVGGVPF